MEHDSDAARLLEAAARAAAEGGAQTRTIRCQLEVTVSEAEWQARYADVASASQRLNTEGEREYVRMVDRVSDEMVDTGFMSAAMMFVGHMLPLVVAGFQSERSQPMGGTTATLIVSGNRTARFQFLPEPDKG
jgi:hypothetical protein